MDENTRNIRTLLVRPGYFSADRDVEGNVRLFRAVIDRAMRDLSDGNPTIREEAEQWFSLRNPDFKLVCELAELSPRRVYNFVLDKWNILRQPLQEEEKKYVASKLKER